MRLNSKSKRALALAAVMAACTGTANAATYSAVADYSNDANPNGVWTYGYYPATVTSAAQFTPYSLTSSDDTWHTVAGLSGLGQELYHTNSYSVVGKNVTPNTIFVDGVIEIDGGELFTHPGDLGEKGTVRFTAPEAGTVDVSAVFSVADNSNGGNRDVHVYVDGIEVFGATLAGAINNSVTSTGDDNISVVNGTVIDFAVGYGTGGYGNDMTTLTALVDLTPVPEPTALVLGLAGMGLLAGRRRRA